MRKTIALIFILSTLMTGFVSCNSNDALSASNENNTEQSDELVFTDEELTNFKKTYEQLGSLFRELENKYENVSDEEKSKVKEDYERLKNEQKVKEDERRKANEEAQKLLAEQEKKQKEEEAKKDEEEELLYGDIKIADNYVTGANAMRGELEILLNKGTLEGQIEDIMTTATSSTTIAEIKINKNHKLNVGEVSNIRNAVTESAQNQGVIRKRTVKVTIIHGDNKYQYNFKLGVGWDKDVTPNS